MKVEKFIDLKYFFLTAIKQFYRGGPESTVFYNVLQTITDSLAVYSSSLEDKNLVIHICQLGIRLREEEKNAVGNSKKI